MQKLDKLNKTALMSLALLTALSAMAIDMYLPAFSQLAYNFHIDFSKIPFTLYVYLIGLACGQCFYGPIIDDFGRKKVLIIGILIFIFGAILVVISKNFYMILFARFIQALGSASIAVIPRTIVVDIYDEKNSAKTFSLFMQILAISPILAPLIGVFLLNNLNWQSIFLLQALFGLMLLASLYITLPETLSQEKREKLKLKAVIEDYLLQFKIKKFMLYCLAAGLAFASLFMYISTSPFIFMEYFNFSSIKYTYIFASGAILMIFLNQVNIMLLKKYSPSSILIFGLSFQMFLTASLAILFILGFKNQYIYILCISITIGFLAFVAGNITAITMKSSRQNGVTSSIFGLIQFGTSSVLGALMTLINSFIPSSNAIISVILLPLCIAFCCILALILVFKSNKITH